MEPTLPLGYLARGFWDRHCDRLRAAGVLTDADADSFTVLCVAFDMVGRLSAFEPGAENFREMVQFNNALKQYHNYARQFGLLPQSRKQAKMQVTPAAKKDEFGL